MRKFPHFKQTDSMTCGPTCLRIIAKYYGKNYKLTQLVKLCNAGRLGTSLLNLSEASEKLGFKPTGIKIAAGELNHEIPLPCIVHWNYSHFVVVYRIEKNNIYVSDPAHGLIKYSKEEFLKFWMRDSQDRGIALLLETTELFYSDADTFVDENKKLEWNIVFKYLKQHKWELVKLGIGLLAGSLIQLIVPFLTQSIVDVGISNRDINFIYLLLLAQLMLFFGRTTIEIVRSYLLMHISTRVNITLVSDFFRKLMSLPISFFDTKLTGDIMQRINDNRRIESFLTGSSLSTLFSLLNFFTYSTVMIIYSVKIFIVFMIGSALYLLWIVFFMRKRAELDFKRFNQGGQQHSKVIELINGMQEIKLHNAEQQKLWEWESIQANAYKINLLGLSYNTAQNSGSSLLNELKNIVITFMAANLVIEGQLTLGMMLSLSYISGQLNAPVMELVRFTHTFQDAKLSLERLNEIHGKTSEEEIKPHAPLADLRGSSLNLNNVSFKYDESGSSYVIKNLSICIPAKKITAIVGSSGSGKTTLMKLLLRFYRADEGEILIGTHNIQNVSIQEWRKKCGVVMQDGFIFNDTIANNIALGVDQIDRQKLEEALEISNANEFIKELPIGYHTKIGQEGTGLSAGQKQRILIARAVYKDPEFLFFDEATSALDSINEKIIIDNLTRFFKNKTVIIIAHRLSTVKSADQVIVLKNGQVIENGSHDELTAFKGIYFELVKNQLELGN